MTLNLKTTDLAAIVLALVAWWNPPVGLMNVIPPVVPSPIVPAPSAAMQAVVAPIAALVVGEKATADRAELAQFFAALADFHARDKGVIVATTQQLRRSDDLATDGMFQATGIKGRYVGLPDAISKGLGASLGILQPDGTFKAQALDAVAAAKATEFFSALAWAFSQQPLPATR